MPFNISLTFMLYTLTRMLYTPVHCPESVIPTAKVTLFSETNKPIPSFNTSLTLQIYAHKYTISYLFKYIYTKIPPHVSQRMEGESRYIANQKSLLLAEQREQIFVNGWLINQTLIVGVSV